MRGEGLYGHEGRGFMGLRLHEGEGLYGHETA